MIEILDSQLLSNSGLLNNIILHSMSDEFYALFYLGLYCESIGETSKASNYMKATVATDYAKGKGRADYMTDCAIVHSKLRHWF